MDTTSFSLFDAEHKRCFMVVWAWSTVKNSINTLDVLDMVWLRVANMKNYDGSPMMVEITDKIVKLIFNKRVYNGNFLPIENSSKKFQKRVLLRLGEAISKQREGEQNIIYSSCIKYLWEKGVITIPIYCQLCDHSDYGRDFRKNEFQINSLIKFIEFYIPLSYDNLPYLDFYLLDGINSSVKDHFMSINIKVLFNAIIINCSREVALIACMTKFLPEELCQIVLFYMIVLFPETITFPIEYSMFLKKQIKN